MFHEGFKYSHELSEKITKKENIEKFKEYKYYIKNNYKIYKKVDISKKDKYRAILMGIFPEIIPFILKCRRLIYKIKI